MLTALARFSEDVTVSAVRAPVEAPISKRDIPRAEIEARNYGQEMPFLLQQVPSVTQYADSGAPAGYSYIYLRGIPQTRMNVTIDGMPINEPEDSAFYFSNFGDLANAVDSIQVQRGVGHVVGRRRLVRRLDQLRERRVHRPAGGDGSPGSRQLRHAAALSASVQLRAASATASSSMGRRPCRTSDGFRHNSGVEPEEPLPRRDAAIRLVVLQGVRVLGRRSRASPTSPPTRPRWPSTCARTR